MEIENLAGVWPNVAINPATGKTYESEDIDTREKLEADIKKYRWEHGETSGLVTEWLDRQAAITEREVKLRELYKFEENHRASIDKTEEVNRELNARITELTAERDHLKKVVQVLADSFAAIENENCALRSKLKRIRELAERLDDGTRNA